AIEGGAFDQREIEARNDVLVYSTEPLEEGVEVTGFIEPTLYVSSDAKDTDFTVKIIDVYPDGTAYNLHETILRARYREGYDREVFMRSEEHTSELQSRFDLVCRLLLEKKNKLYNSAVGRI